MQKMSPSVKHLVSKKNFYLVALTGTLAFSSSFAFSQTPRGEESGFEAELFYINQSVQNPSGLADSEEASNESEKQTEAGVSVDGAWYSELNALVIDYSQSELKYADNSQSDSTTREGSSSWVLGNETTFYQLTAAHSIRRLQRNAGGSTVLLDESEERTISRVSPLLRARFGAADALALSGNFSDIKFEESTQNNSKREGALLQYTRGLSSTTDLFVSAGTNSVEFEENDDADYTQNSLMLGLGREQRYFEYRINVGTAEIETEQGETTNSEIYNFRLISSVAGNRFELVADRSISDTSLGNGNSEFFSDDVSFDGSLAERDQIVRSEAALAWSYQNLCARCDLDAALSWESSEHINISTLDNEQITTELQFSYRFNPQLTALTRLQWIDTTFPDPVATQEDASREVQEIELDYRFNNALAVSIFYENDVRETDTLGASSVATAGLQLTILYEH